MDVLPYVSNADAIELRKRPDVTLSEFQTVGMSAILVQACASVVRELKIRQAVRASLDAAVLARSMLQAAGLNAEIEVLD